MFAAVLTYCIDLKNSCDAELGCNVSMKKYGGRWSKAFLIHCERHPLPVATKQEVSSKDKHNKVRELTQPISVTGQEDSKSTWRRSVHLVCQ